MRYIFIYYNIVYIILLVLIFIYIKKMLNNCYKIEKFENTLDETHSPDETQYPDETQSPDADENDELDKIIQPLILLRDGSTVKTINKHSDIIKNRYNINSNNTTKRNLIETTQSTFEQPEDIANKILGNS